MPDYEPTPMIRGQIEWEVISTPDRVALEERAAQAERRLATYKEQFREVLLEGMSLADWHTKHCAAQQVAVELRKRLEVLSDEDFEELQNTLWAAHGEFCVSSDRCNCNDLSARLEKAQASRTLGPTDV